jgi:hypothetical protein
MKRVGIIQPGRLGDLIILLPAAKYLYEQGYKVFWPIFSEYVEMFSEVASYVTFLPIINNVYTGVQDSYTALKQNNVEKVFDVAATFPGSVCTDEYVMCGDGLGEEKFDEFKYRLLGIPFTEKWNLVVDRNLKAENDLYNKYVTREPYVVTSLNYSKGRVCDIQLDARDRAVVEVNDKHNIFYWIKILENADAMALVDSSLMNLVEQLNLPNKKFLIRRPEGRLPTIRNEWRVV